MSTTRPPLTRQGVFFVGFGSAALLALLIFLVLLFSGFFVSPSAYQEALKASSDAETRLADMGEENMSLREQLVEKSHSITELQNGIQVAQMEAEKALSHAQTAQAQVEVYVEKEQEVEFVVNRRQMEIEKLAKQMHALEGVQVHLVDNGFIVSGLVSPFSLGASRIEDDSLIPQLAEIARVFNAANREQSIQFYAAAVGNTDATAVKSWSGHHSNLWLGAKRARSLFDEMKSAGFPEKETFLISWGDIKSNDQIFHPESRNVQIYIVAREAFKAGSIDAAEGSQSD